LRNYASQCSEKKKGKAKQVLDGTVARVNEGSSQYNTTFSMVLCLYPNTLSCVGWNMDSGASKHMTYDMKLSRRFWEQEGGICGVGC
jgi:hypothetical protein